MHFSRKGIFIICLFLIFLFSSCEVGPLQQYKKNPDRIFLTEWEYKVDGESYKPLELKDMERLYRVAPSKKGYVTLRTTVTLPDDYPQEDIAINFGSISIAAKFFLDGKQVYSVGFFPPKAFTSGSKLIV